MPGDQAQRLLQRGAGPLPREQPVLEQIRLLDGQVGPLGHAARRADLDVEEIDRRPVAARLDGVEAQRAQHGPEGRPGRIVERQLQVLHRRRQVADPVLEHPRRGVAQRARGGARAPVRLLDHRQRLRLPLRRRPGEPAPRVLRTGRDPGVRLGHVVGTRVVG